MQVADNKALNVSSDPNGIRTRVRTNSQRLHAWGEGSDLREKSAHPRVGAIGTQYLRSPLCARLLGFHIREISSSIRLKPPLYPLNYGDSLLSTTYEVALLAAGLRYENFMHF